MDGGFGTLSGNLGPYTVALYINMDAGGCIVTKPANVVPWDAYLDTVMLAVDHNPDPDSDHVPPADADRVLRGSPAKMRNALDSSNRAGQTYYYQGIALGEAEVGRRTDERRLGPRDDTEDPRNSAPPWPAAGIPVDELRPEEIKMRTAAPCR